LGRRLEHRRRSFAQSAGKAKTSKVTARPAATNVIEVTREREKERGLYLQKENGFAPSNLVRKLKGGKTLTHFKVRRKVKGRNTTRGHLAITFWGQFS